MSQDNYFAIIASRAIDKWYDNKNGFIFEVKDSKSLTKLLDSIIRGKKRIKGNTRTIIESRFSIDIMVKNHWLFVSK